MTEELYLTSYDIYLAHSSMERDRGKELQKELEEVGYKVYNPFYTRRREDIAAIDAGEARLWDFKGRRQEALMNIVWPDLTAVANARMLLAILPKEMKVFGTVCEIFWAWQLHKEVVIITDTHKGHPWVEGLSDQVGTQVEIWNILRSLDFLPGVR